MALLHRVSKNTCHFYYYDNFGKREPIFTFFSLLSSEKICGKKEIKTSTYPQICCRTTLWNVNGQLYSFTFILARITCFMSSDTCFTSSYLFIYFFFLILTSLRRYCSILFVALLIPFSYEDKRLAQRWTMHNWRIHSLVPFTTPNMHLCLKADILNTWRKLARVEKQRNSIPREHLP